MTATITLFGVDLARVHEAWRTRTIDRLIGERPRGRIASLLAGPLDGVVVDGGRPAPAALAGVSPESRRAIFDALVEDLAEVALFDTPAPVLTDVFGAIARLSGREALLAPRLEAAAAAAYPSELLQEPFVQDASSGGGLVAWISDPALASVAHAAARKAVDLPAGAFPTAEPTIFYDVADALVPVLAIAARVGGALVALR